VTVGPTGGRRITLSTSSTSILSVIRTTTTIFTFNPTSVLMYLVFSRSTRSSSLDLEKLFRLIRWRWDMNCTIRQKEKRKTLTRTTRTLRTYLERVLLHFVREIARRPFELYSLQIFWETFRKEATDPSGGCRGEVHTLG